MLQSLLRSARNQWHDESSESCPEWDSDMVSFLLLLHILPPQPSKKKTQKISASQAIDHLVVFHKSCKSLEEQLENQEGHRQPYLLASGTSKQAISTFYIVLDKKLIPCQGTTSLAAFDELFKVHFVFSVSYDTALSNMQHSFRPQSTVLMLTPLKKAQSEMSRHGLNIMVLSITQVLLFALILYMRCQCSVRLFVSFCEIKCFFVYQKWRLHLRSIFMLLMLLTKCIMFQLYQLMS
ncbi:hypothetical protein QTP86_014708 [Hemibagrus guttatus]|nr:hypothetical protein QTP86_014708 [Hemibagrus guttatus]